MGNTKSNPDPLWLVLAMETGHTHAVRPWAGRRRARRGTEASDHRISPSAVYLWTNFSPRSIFSSTPTPNIHLAQDHDLHRNVTPSSSPSSPSSPLLSPPLPLRLTRSVAIHLFPKSNCLHIRCRLAQPSPAQLSPASKASKASKASHLHTRLVCTGRILTSTSSQRRDFALLVLYPGPRRLGTAGESGAPPERKPRWDTDAKIWCKPTCSDQATCCFFPCLPTMDLLIISSLCGRSWPD